MEDKSEYENIKDIHKPDTIVNESEQNPNHISIENESDSNRAKIKKKKIPNNKIEPVYTNPNFPYVVYNYNPIRSNHDYIMREEVKNSRHSDLILRNSKELHDIAGTLKSAAVNSKNYMKYQVFAHLILFFVFLPCYCLGNHGVNNLNKRQSKAYLIYLIILLFTKIILVIVLPFINIMALCAIGFIFISFCIDLCTFFSYFKYVKILNKLTEDDINRLKEWYLYIEDSNNKGN